MRRSQTDAPGPVRSCIGCRERRPQSALVRITRSARGISIDGASDGRGAWLCRSGTDQDRGDSCLAAAIARRGFARAWRADVSPEELRIISEQLGTPAGGSRRRDESAAY